MTNNYGNLELHKVLLSAMKDIDKICRDNGLRYFLYAGTLLGAVNHKGFIPWDDDVDIVMMPEDFKQFCDVIDKEYCGVYKMMSYDSAPDWYSKMNKMMICGTEMHGQHGEAHLAFVDMCVLHNVPDDLKKRSVQRRKIEFINLVLAAKSGAIIPTSFKSRAVLGNLSKLSKQFWGRRLERIMTRYDRETTENVGIMCNTLTKNPYTGRTGYDTDMTKRIWHEQPQMVPFEDTKFMTFSNIDEYLTYQFGPRYMDPYPEEKRITKHDIKSYKISPEVRVRVGL